VGHDDPDPRLGIQPDASASVRMIGSMSACSKAFRIWLDASSWTTSVSGYSGRSTAATITSGCARAASTSVLREWNGMPSWR
jgi:hypothetical protein